MQAERGRARSRYGDGRHAGADDGSRRLARGARTNLPAVARPVSVPAPPRQRTHTTSDPSRWHPAPLQEDDEFEEFEQQEWTQAEEDVQDPTMWQDGWEDDEDDDDFTRQIRAELEETEAPKEQAAQPMAT